MGEQVSILKSGRDAFVTDVLLYIRDECSDARLVIKDHKNGFNVIFRFATGYSIGEYFDTREAVEVFLDDLIPLVNMGLTEKGKREAFYVFKMFGDAEDGKLPPSIAEINRNCKECQTD